MVKLDVKKYQKLEMICIIASIFICMMLIFVNIPENINNSKNDYSKYHWYYFENGEKIDIELPATIQSDDEVLTIYCDDLTKEDEGLMLSTKSAIYDVKVSYNDQYIYEYDDSLFPRNDQMKNKYICLIDLPKDIRDARLSIELFNDGSNKYVIDTIIIDRGDIVMNSYYSSVFVPMSIAVFMFVLGLFTILAYGYLKFLNIKDERLLMIATFIIMCSIWCITDSSIAQYNNPYYHINYLVSFYMFILFAIPMLHLLKRYINNNIIHILISLFYANAIIQGILNYLGYFEFIDMLFITHILLVVAIIVCIWQLHNCNKENNQLDIQVILLAFIVLTFFGLLAIVLYWILNIKYYDLIFEVGILIFIILLLGGLLISISQNLKYKTELIIYRKLAKEDKLTGIGNRRSFDEYIDSIYNMGDSLDNAILFFIDVDYLKSINDNYGHNAGDEIIVATARCMKETFKNHVCYRIGGDEFCGIVINSKYDADHYLNILDEQVNIFNKQSTRLKLSLSKGYSILKNDDGSYKTISDWKQNADMNMYKDKAGKIR